jgi:GNAT superfamily N-acetyltransferase
MKRKTGVHVPEIPLPDGFTFVFFKTGDEKSWAEIETSVHEFNNEQEALEYFSKEFMPHISELEKRCLFVENSKGEKVATAAAWKDSKGPRLHWVAVKPEAQGLGLGKAISAKATRLLLELDGDVEFYLTTQTWSRRAVRIYEKLGWVMAYDKNNRKYSRVNYEQAKKILRRIKH